jgi:hypothetical protein
MNKKEIFELFKQVVSKGKLVCENPNNFLEMVDRDGTCYPRTCIVNNVQYMKPNDKIIEDLVIYRLSEKVKRYNDRDVDDKNCTLLFDKYVVYENHVDTYESSKVRNLSKVIIQGAEYVDVDKEIEKTSSSIEKLNIFKCKRSVSNEDNPKVLDLQTIEYEKAYIKTLSGSFKTVFIPISGSKMMPGFSQIIYIEEADNVDTLKARYCHTSCLNAKADSGYYEEKSNAQFKRVNFAPLIKDNFEDSESCILKSKSNMEVDINTLKLSSEIEDMSFKCLQEDLKAVSYDSLIFDPRLDSDDTYTFKNLETVYKSNSCIQECGDNYEKVGNSCKIKFILNNETIWYDADNIKRQLTTSCGPDKYISRWATKKYIGNKWYYNSDTVCSELIKCVNATEKTLQFKYEGNHIMTKSSSKLFPFINQIPIGLIKCNSIHLSYVFKSSCYNFDHNPILILKKKSKEVVLKHYLNPKIADTQIIKGNVLNEHIFEPFNIYPNDFDQFQLIVNVDECFGELTEVLLELKCEQEEKRNEDHVNATSTKFQGKNATCIAKHRNKCDYTNHYYKKINNEYFCLGYKTEMMKCDPTRLQIKSDDQSKCLSTQYKYATKNVNHPEIYNRNTININSYDECASECDNKSSCIGINYSPVSTVCTLYGYETSRIIISTSKKDYKVQVFTIDDNENEAALTKRNLMTDVELYILDNPVSLKRIAIQGNFNGTSLQIQLFDKKNNVQKTFSNASEYKNTDSDIDRYMSNSELYIFEYFYQSEAQILNRIQKNLTNIQKVKTEENERLSLENERKKLLLLERQKLVDRKVEEGKLEEQRLKERKLAEQRLNIQELNERNLEQQRLRNRRLESIN